MQMLSLFSGHALLMIRDRCVTITAACPLLPPPGLCLLKSA